MAAGVRPGGCLGWVGHASDRCPLLRRLLRPPLRPSARGAAADHRQGRRLRARARRRGRLQAAELDDAADRRDRGWQHDRRAQGQGRGSARDHAARGRGRHDHAMDFDADRLSKDGVEADLQEALAAAPHFCGEGFRLVRREWPTDIGPVDLMCRDEADGWIAVEIKRVGTIDAVEQLTATWSGSGSIRPRPTAAACSRRRSSSRRRRCSPRRAGSAGSRSTWRCCAASANPR